jgi:hypothetical protein
VYVSPVALARSVQLVVAKTKPAMVTEPKILGTARIGSPVTASPGTWTGAVPITFTFEWAICAPGSNTCYYNGAKGLTFTPSSSVAVGSRVVVVVTARNPVGTGFGQSMATVPLTR